MLKFNILGIRDFKNKGHEDTSLNRKFKKQLHQFIGALMT